MATTEHFYTGNASTTSFGFTFPILQNSDLKVELDGVLKTENTSGTNNDYSISGTNVVFNSAPGSSVDIHIYRLTDVDSAKAVFAAGSSIRAGDLNNNVDQNLYANQEQQQKIKTSDVWDDAITTAKIKDGTIVNANINASAAIDGTKISPNFGSQNIVTSGTVDGRDVSVDGSKLDGIEDNATRDQDASEIKTLLQSNKLTVDEIANDAITYAKIQNVSATDRVLGRDSSGAGDIEEITPASLRTMINVEDGATADQTGAEIKSAYEGESDTNAFTDAEKVKLGNLGSLNALSDVDTSGVSDNKILKYDSSVSKFVIADDGGGGGSGGSSTFTGLSDTPANFGGAANKTLKINSDGDAVEFVDVTTSFVGLTDTPSSLSGQGGKSVLVNSGGTALEFGTINTDLELDNSPSLSSNLDVAGHSILTNTTNGSIQLVPNGTGNVTISGAGGNDGTLQLNCSANSHGVKIKSPPHSAAASYTLTLPEADGTQGTFLKTDGSGALSFVDPNKILQGNSSAEITGTGNDAGIFEIKLQSSVGNANDAQTSLKQSHTGNTNQTILNEGNKDKNSLLELNHSWGTNAFSEIQFRQTGNTAGTNKIRSDGHSELSFFADGTGTKKLNINATLSSFGTEVYPLSDNAKKLGSTNYKWSEVHATTFHGSGANLTDIESTVANGCIYENNTEITTDFTTSTTKNSMSAGPITIANNVTLTIPNNSVYTIV